MGHKAFPSYIESLVRCLSLRSNAKSNAGCFNESWKCYWVFICLLLLVFQATSGMAQNAQKLKPVGETTTWLTQSGVTSITYMGEVGEHLEYLMWRDGSANNPTITRFLTNKKGETIEAVTNGIITTYSPSNCSKTIGRCTYLKKRSDGHDRYMISNLHQNGESRFYTLHNENETDENLLEFGSFNVVYQGVKYDRWAVHVSKNKQTIAWSKRQ